MSDAYIATHYQRIRFASLMLGVVALVPALTGLYNGVSDTFYGGMGFVPYDDVTILFVLLVASLVLTPLAAQRFLGHSGPGAAALERGALCFFAHAAAPRLLYGGSCVL